MTLPWIPHLARLVRWRALGLLHRVRSGGSGREGRVWRNPEVKGWLRRDPHRSRGDRVGDHLYGSRSQITDRSNIRFVDFRTITHFTAIVKRRKNQVQTHQSVSLNPYRVQQ